MFTFSALLERTLSDASKDFTETFSQLCICILQWMWYDDFLVTSTHFLALHLSFWGFVIWHYTVYGNTASFHSIKPETLKFKRNVGFRTTSWFHCFINTLKTTTSTTKSLKFKYVSLAFIYSVRFNAHHIKQKGKEINQSICYCEQFCPHCRRKTLTCFILAACMHWTNAWNFVLMSITSYYTRQIWPFVTCRQRLF